MSQADPPQTYQFQHFLISTEISRIDVKMVHQFLAYESYWIPGISVQEVERLLEHALCFGVYDCSQDDEMQVGFARVITDFASHAYIADLFIRSTYRGQGLGKWLVSCILAHPKLQNLRKWMLHTRDAHGLYQRFGFRLNADKDTYMSYNPRDLKA
jgi:GNAT superfamily N-acetyltransferase